MVVALPLNFLGLVLNRGLSTLAIDTHFLRKRFVILQNLQKSVQNNVSDVFDTFTSDLYNQLNIDPSPFEFINEKQQWSPNSHDEYSSLAASLENVLLMRRKKPKRPPDGYLCHLCFCKGHYIKDCPQVSLPSLAETAAVIARVYLASLEFVFIHWSPRLDHPRVDQYQGLNNWTRQKQSNAEQKIYLSFGIFNHKKSESLTLG